MFKDITSEKGQNELNGYLADHSYVKGFQLSKEDLDAFKQLKSAPAKSLTNLCRWYNHIKSFSPSDLKQLEQSSGAKPKTPAKASKEDDDVDLFGSDDEQEDAEAAKIREERLKAYSDKKAKKPALIAKSSVIMDVKPWDDETDMKDMEKNVRAITMPGLLWGAAKLVPVGYGIYKLQIMCVVEDDKVSIDLLVEMIEEIDHLVQSVDIVAFNKI